MIGKEDAWAVMLSTRAFFMFTRSFFVQLRDRQYDYRRLAGRAYNISDFICENKAWLR